MSDATISIILAISFWIHFIGISIWVGGSLLLPLVIQPALGSLEPSSRLKPMAAIAAKLTPLFGISIALVFLSGIVQTVLLYKSVPRLTLDIKILVALLMVANGIYVGVFLTRRVVALAPADGVPPTPEFLKAQRMLVMHSWVQFGMAILILLIVGFLAAGL